MSTEIHTLEAQGKELIALVGELSAEDLSRPTRCPPLTVREIVGHVGSMFHRFTEALGQDFEEPVSHDRSSYYAVFRDEVAPLVVEESQSEAGERSDEELRSWLEDGIATAVQTARATPPDKVTGTRRFPRRLTALDFTATRVLECGVHTMDISHATLRGERIHPDAAAIVIEILDGLLGSRLPVSLGWDQRTYILTGTGRRPLEANERYVLGPLAERFPLLR